VGEIFPQRLHRRELLVKTHIFEGKVNGMEKVYLRGRWFKYQTYGYCAARAGSKRMSIVVQFADSSGSRSFLDLPSRKDQDSWVTF